MYHQHPRSRRWDLEAPQPAVHHALVAAKSEAAAAQVALAEVGWMVDGGIFLGGGSSRSVGLGFLLLLICS